MTLGIIRLFLVATFIRHCYVNSISTKANEQWRKFQMNAMLSAQNDINHLRLKYSLIEHRGFAFFFFICHKVEKIARMIDKV